MNTHNTKILTKIFSLILAQVFLATSLVCPASLPHNKYLDHSINSSNIAYIPNLEFTGKLRSPMGFGKDGGLSERAKAIKNTKIIPQAGENWGFADLHAASYIENPTTDNLINKAKEYHQIGSREAKLLAGDFAIQALNKIAVEKIAINVSELEPILKDFEDEAYDESGAIKNLTGFLSQNPDINKENMSKLEEELENVNNMNERTELSVRFPKHQPGYDLMDPINKIMNHIEYLISLNSKRETKQLSRDEVELLLGIQDLLMNRVTVLFKLVQNRIDARKAKTYDISLPTMSISEAAEWRRALHDMISNARDKSCRKVFDKDESLLHTYMNIWYLSDFTLSPLVKGKPLVMDCNLKQVAERALENILWELGRDLSKDAVLMEFDKDIKDFGITADPTMIKEAFKILMQNSIQVAKERLEDENEDRKSRHLESLTLKDRPIQLKIFLTRDKGGAVSLQVIEMSDNVGGISDPLLLEETRPGNGRQKVTELNTSRRKKDTGFGLAYVWHIVSLHGGTFWIRNIDDTPGKGIIASMRIPMRLPKDKETVSNDALASNGSLTERELYPYFGLDYSAEARQNGPLWLKLRSVRLSIREEATLYGVLTDTLSQEGNIQIAISALRVAVDESRFLEDKYSVGSEEYNKKMKKILVLGLRLLTQTIYKESDIRVRDYNSRQLAFLAERFIRRFVEENYSVENYNGRLEPCLGNYFIGTSEEFLGAMINGFLNWLSEDMDVRPFMRTAYTRRAVLVLGVAGAVTTTGYAAYQMFEPSKRTLERLNRLKELPVTAKVSDDAKTQYVYECKYLAGLRTNNQNRLNSYDYEWLKDFLNKNTERRPAIIFAARVFEIEPELLAGFLLEEEFNGDTKNKIKYFIRELIGKEASIHQDMDYRGTVGLGQINTSHAISRAFLDMLYENKERLKPMLTMESQRLFNEFESFYSNDIYGSKQSEASVNHALEVKKGLITNLAEQEEINILLTAFVIMRNFAYKIAENNKNETTIPDMRPLSGPSTGWILKESEYREIPTIALRERYGRPFGGINYYHPLMRYFAVAQRYTGAGPANYKRGLIKVKLYRMFLESGIFRGAPDVRPGPTPRIEPNSLPSRGIMAGL